MQTFENGVFPPDSKTLTNKRPIGDLAAEPEEIFVFPTVQHIGARVEPLVKKGDEVKVGEIIADSPAIVASPVLASVSGKVTAIKKATTPTGFSVESIFVENDGLFTPVPPTDHGNYKNFSKEDIWRLVRDAGIVGLGGAGFPTHIKLNPPQDAPIDTYIINGAECEPYLTLDHRLMLEEAEDIKRGVEVIRMLFPNVNVIFGIEANKPDAIDHITQVFSQMENFTVVPLLPKYPQGAEKQLIYATTNRTVPSGTLPSKVGCLVNNVDTVKAIGEAVVFNRPLLSRVITVTGSAIKEPGNFRVPLGMSYQRLVAAAGGFVEEPEKLLSGGPMMGTNLFTLDVPVVKTSSSIVALREAEVELREEDNCIRCGRCVDHCPINLLPFELDYYSRAKDTDAFVSFNGIDCIECGSCSYICPSKRYLAQSIRMGKKLLDVAMRK